MKTKLLLSILMLILWVSSHAQLRPDLAFHSIPDTLMKNAQEVVRFERKVFKIRSIKEGSLSHKKAVTILSKSSSANQIELYYDAASKLGRVRANLYDAFGNLIRKVSQSEIKDLPANGNSTIVGDNRVKILNVNHNEYPYTLEYEYDQELRGVYYCVFPDWHIQYYDASLQKGRFIVEIPKDMKFYYKALNTDAVPEIKEKDRTISYEWKVDNLTAIEWEPYGPLHFEILPVIMCSPDEFNIKGYKGSMASWKDYGLFMHQLYEEKDELPQALLTEVRALTKDAPTDRDKIEILYRFMQDNTRYVSVQLGIGGWQPFDAEYVYENKYGDCKALTNYMKAMLKAVGVTAYPVLIKNGRLNYELTEDFTTSKFNHVILNVPSEDCWLECTSQSFPVNYIGGSNSNRNALMVTEEGGKLIRTPILEKNMETNKAEIQLDENGAAVLNVINQAYGRRHEWYRWRTNESKEEREETFKENSSLPSFSIKDLKVEVSANAPISKTEYTFTIPRYASKGGRRLFVPVNALNPFTSVPPELENRKNAINLKSSYTELDTINIKIPEGFEIESVPDKTFKIDTDYLLYEMQIEGGNSELVYKRKLEVKTTELPSEAYAEFRKQFLDIAKKDKTKVVLVKKKT